MEGLIRKRKPKDDATDTTKASVGAPGGSYSAIHWIIIVLLISVVLLINDVAVILLLKTGWIDNIITIEQERLIV